MAAGEGVQGDTGNLESWAAPGMRGCWSGVNGDVGMSGGCGGY